MERRNVRNAKSNTVNYYSDGNLAHRYDELGYYQRMRIREKRLARHRQQQAALRKERLIRGLISAACGVVVIGFCVALLSAISRNNALTVELSRLDAQIEELTVLNDSKEYDLDAAVDLDYVIQVATQEFGMVRSSASQIRTYETQNSEYVQQVAEVPTE